MKKYLDIDVYRERVIQDYSMVVVSSKDATWLWSCMVALKRHLSHPAKFLHYLLHLEWEKNNTYTFPKNCQKMFPDCKLDLVAAMDELIERGIVEPDGDGSIWLLPDYTWNCPEGKLSEKTAEISFKVYDKPKSED